MRPVASLSFRRVALAGPVIVLAILLWVACGRWGAWGFLGLGGWPRTADLADGGEHPEVARFVGYVDGVVALSKEERSGFTCFRDGGSILVFAGDPETASPDSMLKVDMEDVYGAGVTVEEAWRSLEEFARERIGGSHEAEAP